MRYTQTDELEFLNTIRYKVLHENLLVLSLGTSLFRDAGIIITDDVEQEFLSEDSVETVIETEYAVELSWIFNEIRDGLSDTFHDYRKEDFFFNLADAALTVIGRTDDRTAILIGVILEASMMVSRARQQRCDALRDEVLSCAAGLTDLAEKL